MTLTEQYIFLQAPSPSAAENGRKLSKGNKFSNLHRSADDTLYWATCAGSGKNPYQTSIDFKKTDAPVCRCSCPSRQFPCKHSLGLMFEILAAKTFDTAEIPADIAEKRAKKEARDAKKESDKNAPAKPKKTNAAAQAKKLKRQLEGLDMAEKMVNQLLTSGIGTLSGSSAQSFDKLAKDLGSYYLTGPQMAFSRIALSVKEVQKNPEQADAIYAEALRTLIYLHSTIKKSHEFLQKKLNAGEYSAEDTVLFEALGGVWRLDDLHAIQAYRENVKLIQLSFDVSCDEVKKEYVERGYWIDLDTGQIDHTLNLRPMKALKYVKAADSCFELLDVPILYTYPGEGNRRIRYDGFTSRPIREKEQAMLPSLAQPTLAAAIKLTKGQIKNTLLPKFLAVLVPVEHIGKIDKEFVLEDSSGSRIVLRDRKEDGKDHFCTNRIAMIPGGIPKGSALFGLMFYDNQDNRICLHPYSLVTTKQIIRLQY